MSTLSSSPTARANLLALLAAVVIVGASIAVWLAFGVHQPLAPLPVPAPAHEVPFHVTTVPGHLVSV